ncbi:MAG: hypothetical protein B1H02_04795 [Candidatus Latescibacteria bacterium 4484_107]|nr:MAG: hypothetical protein B1H02_04795 [Candidatus Latescibacteria bacterium 4484_107]
MKSETPRPPHIRFNFAMGLIHGILFQTGMAFSAPMSVLPVFLSHFTGSLTMIGVFSALMNVGGVLPQLFVAHRLESKPRKKPVLVVAIWVRAAAWAILGLLTYFCVECNTLIILVALLVLLFTFSFAGGVAGIPFTDIWGKALPAMLRGRFFGYRQLFGGLMAIGAGYVVKQILGDPSLSFPRNYAFLFLLSFVFIAVSYIALSSVREPEGEVHAQPRRLSVFLKQSVRILWEDRNFGWFMLTQLAMGFSALAMPFYVLYGKDKLGMAAEQVGILVGAQIAGAIVSNLIWAPLSDRVGNRIVCILTAATAVMIPLSALLSSTVGWTLLIVVFVLIGVSTSGAGIGFTNYLLEIAPGPLRPAYIALRGTLAGGMFVMPILGGLIVDVYSYPAAFVVSLIALLMAVGFSFKLKPVRSVGASR